MQLGRLLHLPLFSDFRVVGSVIAVVVLPTAVHFRPSICVRAPIGPQRP